MSRSARGAGADTSDSGRDEVAGPIGARGGELGEGGSGRSGAGEVSGLGDVPSDACRVRNAEPAKKPEDLFVLGTENAKLFRQEGLRTQAVRSMAESAKRKSDALEECNAIDAFASPEEAELPEKTKFFAALRTNYLAQALKRSRVMSAKISTAKANDNTDSTTQQESSLSASETHTVHLGEVHE